MRRKATAKNGEVTCYRWRHRKNRTLWKAMCTSIKHAWAPPNVFPDSSGGRKGRKTINALRTIHKSCGSDPILIEIHVPHAAAACVMWLRQETWSGTPDTCQFSFKMTKISKMFDTLNFCCTNLVHSQHLTKTHWDIKRIFLGTGTGEPPGL